MREQKANDNGFPVVGKQVKEQQTFPFDQLVKYDGATNKITINANLTINGDTNIGELDIDSGDAPKGQVLTANGQSGASWENRVEYLNLESESGNLTNAQIEVAEQDNVIITLNGQFYYKNSQSDEAIVFKAPAKVVDDDTIVEKVAIDLSDNTYSYSYEVVATGGSFEPTYDDELNGSSTNAVQNKVVYAALNEKADTEKIENGQIVAGKSLTTKQVENVSEDSGSTQTTPFLFQATGTNNNTTETPTAPVAKQLELRGNSVVVNQLVNTGDTEVQTISGRKYWTFINGNYAIITSSGSAITLNDASVDKVVDLTQWFNGDIPQDILDHPEKFINYYQGSLAYNTGTIVDCNATELDTIEFNQWDEEWENGSYNLENGTKLADNTTIRSKNLIEVISNKSYYLKSPTACRIFFYDANENYISYINWINNNTFTTPTNCKFIAFYVASAYGTTYNHDICINLSWDGQRDGEYQPFKKHPYALGNDVLKSAGRVFDSKAPDGTITRKIRSYTFTGNESLSNFTMAAEDKGFIFEIVSNGLPAAKSGASCPSKTEFNMTQAINYDFFRIATTPTYAILDGSRLYVYSPSIQTASDMLVFLTGKTFYYELAEPTTEQGTAFAENIIVDDYGTMKFVNTNGVPQGNKFFYPADYVLLMDNLNNYLDDNDKGISDLAFKSEISDSALAERGYLKLASLSGYDDTKTQTLKNIEGVFTWVDDE